MLDHFDEKRLPSFSNEPQQFGNMTLFMSGGQLVLHIQSNIEGRVAKGRSVSSVADYYLNYETREKEHFLGFAEMQMAYIESNLKRRGKSRDISPERREEIIEGIILEVASRVASNCEDHHDLSPEFCTATRKLGEALQQRSMAGIKTMTVMHSMRSGMSVANNPKLII